MPTSWPKHTDSRAGDGKKRVRCEQLGEADSPPSALSAVVSPRLICLTQRGAWWSWINSRAVLVSLQPPGQVKETWRNLMVSVDSVLKLGRGQEKWNNTNKSRHDLPCFVCEELMAWGNLLSCGTSVTKLLQDRPPSSNLFSIVRTLKGRSASRALHLHPRTPGNPWNSTVFLLCLHLGKASLGFSDSQSCLCLGKG